MFNEDMSQFFNPAEFADLANFAGVGSVAGIFDEAYIRTSGAMGMENSAPAILLPNASVPASVINRTVTIKSVNYTVVEKEPNETPGLTTLILERV